MRNYHLGLEMRLSHCWIRAIDFSYYLVLSGVQRVLAKNPCDPQEILDCAACLRRPPFREAFRTKGTKVLTPTPLRSRGLHVRVASAALCSQCKAKGSYSFQLATRRFLPAGLGVGSDCTSLWLCYRVSIGGLPPHEKLFLFVFFRKYYSAVFLPKFCTC